MQLEDVFNYGLIKTLDLKETASEVAKIVLNTISSINLGSQMNEDQIVDLSFDLCELFKYDTIADIVIMFRMFRQGKIGKNPITPMKVFDQRYINTILVPEYLGLKADERLQINRKKGAEHVIEANKKIENLGILSEMELDFGVNQDVKQDEVTDQFKKWAENAEYKDLNDWVMQYRKYKRLNNKVEFVKQIIRNQQ